jgi:hypothetical protein
MSLLDVAVIAMIIAGLAAFGASLKWLPWPPRARKPMSGTRR